MIVGSDRETTIYTLKSALIGSLREAPEPKMVKMVAYKWDQVAEELITARK